MLLYKQEEKLKTEMAWKKDDVGVWDQPHAFVLCTSSYQFANLQISWAWWCLAQTSWTPA
jgi:hypothetical protein